MSSEDKPQNGEQTSQTMADDADNADDGALMSAYIRGDVRAFERLYQRHKGPLYRFIRRLLGSALVARTDEVFQDTWLRVIEKQASWKPKGAFRPWLFAIGLELWPAPNASPL